MRRENSVGILGIVLVFVGIFIFSTSIVSATILIGNSSHSISSKYGPSQSIVGWVNISVSNEYLNSTFTDSLGNKAILKDVLLKNSGFSYSCLPDNCEDDYSAQNPNLAKSLDNPSSKLYGILFKENINSIDSVSFNVSSNFEIPASCNSQFEIDFFNDGEIDVTNTQADSSLCAGTKTYGCYSTAESNSEYKIGNKDSMYCEKVTLPKAPGFSIGAWVKKSGSEEIIMELRDNEGNKLNECMLPDATLAGGEISCDVDLVVQEIGDYYVCIFSVQGEQGYSIKGYSNSNSCGIFGEPYPGKITEADYSIFAQAKQYASIKNVGILDNLPNKQKLSTLVKDYIVNKYGSLDCSKNNCVVPINFTINADEEIDKMNINNLKADLHTSTGIKTENNLYDISKISGKTSFGFGKLYLDNTELKAKSTTGNFIYSLSLNGKEIFSGEKLSVQKTPNITGINPLSTAYAFPTTFILSTSSPKDVNSYKWNFGDNTSEITTPTNKTTHIYNSSGNYNLSVIITDNNGITSSKSFTIEVSSPKQLIETTLSRMQKDVVSIKADIAKLDIFKKSSIESLINTTYLSSKINELQLKYNSSNETSYGSIVSELILLKVPESINSTQSTQNTILYPDKSIINIGILAEIGEEEYDFSTEDKYKDAIIIWNNQNLEEKIVFERIYAIYPENSENILKIFNFTINQKSSANYPSYFIMESLDNIKFSQDYLVKSSGDYVYVELHPGQNNIIFSTTEDIILEDIPVFISPGLSQLSIDSETLNPTESEFSFNWLLYILVLIALIILGVIVYVGLIIWYKRKYERFLFPNRNDLYNLYSFIELQKRKGTTEKDVVSKLKSAGWSGEQVRYVIRKYSGKNTGMPLSELIKESHHIEHK